MQTLLPIIDSRTVVPGLLEQPVDPLRAWLVEHGQPAMRVKQIRRWLLEGRAESFEQMSDLPKNLRTDLAATFAPLSTKIEKHQAASDDTHKLLLRLADDGLIECVLIQEPPRRTACISTQVGCGMGCVFCASGLDGVARNLTAGEILEQLVRLRNLTPPGERLTHIVVMGMGEPLANLDNLLPALEVAGDKHGLAGIGGTTHHDFNGPGCPPKDAPGWPGNSISNIIWLSPLHALQRPLANADRADQRANRHCRHYGGGRRVFREDRAAGDV